MSNELCNIAAIGDDSLLSGFKLAGVRNLHYATNPKEEEETLVKLMKQKDVGIIIISEQLLEEIDLRLKRKVEDAAKPVVIAVPGRSGPMEQTESLAKLIKRALGFDIMGKEKK
ncbi:MAG: V-type ATP synthase subunit F [Candidatus Micrarchaeota archaeon]